MIFQEHEIPTVVILKEGAEYKTSIANNVVYAETAPNQTDVFIDFSTYATVSGLVDTLLELQTKNASEEVFVDVINEFITTNLKETIYYNTLLNLIVALVNNKVDTTKLSFYITNYLQTIKNDTLMSFRLNLGKTPEDGNTPVDVDFSGVKYFNCLADIYNSAESQDKQLNIDIQQGLGRVTRIDTDLVCSSLANAYTDVSIYSTASGIAPQALTRHCCSYSTITCSGVTCSGVTCSGVTCSGVTCSGVTCSGVYPGGYFCAPTYSGLLNLCSTYSGCVYEDLDYCINNTYSGSVYYAPTYSGCTYENLEYHINNYSGGLPIDVQISPGKITTISTDIFSTKLGISGGLVSDLKTKSLFIDNFFIETDKFTTASSIAWIDIFDYIYPIDTEHTYLYINDTLASGIYFEDIPNGKRLYYDPIDDFYSKGIIIYTVHAESTIGEVDEKNFYLLYGYDLQLNEVVDWGPSNRVIVRIIAHNLAFCPNIAGESFDFVTVDLDSIDLPCIIQPVEYIDLPIGISPQSTAFFYGRTYTVRLANVRDFSGNLMPDLEYTFTIENP